MKYIKENIRIKDGQKIYDDDLKILVPFINEIQNNDFVECICLIPIYKQEEVAREPKDYCDIDIKIFVNEELKDYEEIKSGINKVHYDLCNRYLPINEYNFEIIDLKKFNPNYSIYSSLCKKDLVSSYIIYDKNGTFGELQEELESQVRPWGSLVQIENIEKLDVRTKSDCNTAEVKLGIKKKIKQLIK